MKTTADLPVTIEMPEAIRKAWLRDLRSGEYEQGRRAMVTPSGFYCCLGVMVCSIEGRRIDCTEMQKYSKGLPNKRYLEKHGIRFANKEGEEGSTYPYLPSIGKDAHVANDVHNYTFAEIADAIEACSVGY